MLAVLASLSACTSATELDDEAAQSEATVLVASGSPITVLADEALADAVAAGDADACREIDQRSTEELAESDFIQELNDLAQDHPTTHADLVSELALLGRVLEACIDGEQPDPDDIERLDGVLERWQERTS